MNIGEVADKIQMPANAIQLASVVVSTARDANVTSDVDQMATRSVGGTTRRTTIPTPIRMPATVRSDSGCSVRSKPPCRRLSASTKATAASATVHDRQSKRGSCCVIRLAAGEWIVEPNAMTAYILG